MAAEEAEDEAKEETAVAATKKLSHKQFRRLIKKEKRRLRRQKAAKQRDKEEEHEKWRIENDPVLRARLELQEKKTEEQLNKEEQESTKQHQLWLERDVLAQEQFKRKREEEERKTQEKLEQERRIKEEWEEQQRKEKEEEERKQQAVKEKEDVLFRELDKPADATQRSAWHNPLAPSASSQNYGTEKDTVNCSFYLKTGACRFAERCSRHHPRPPSSVTLLIPGMFQDVRLTQSMLDEADHDTGLEYDEYETKEKFDEFFEDAIEEFKKAGTVVQFKACCNHEPHLRGNVYVQYKTEEGCAQAFLMFNGRWYAGRQLSCEYSPVTKWKSAICGLFERGSCPRGKNCNFLHAYKNPGNAFRHMDRDLSPGSLESEHHRRDWTEDRFGRHRDWNRYCDRDHSRSRDRDYRDYEGSRDRDRERSRHRRERERTHERDDYRREDRYDRRRRSQDENTRSHDRHRRDRTHERSTEKDEQSNRESDGDKQTHNRLCHQEVNEEDNKNNRLKEATEGDHSPEQNQSHKRKHLSPKHHKSAKKKHKHHKKHKHKRHSSSDNSAEEDEVNGNS